MRGFYAVPLADDDGRVGTLSFESSDPDFLGPAHLEMIKILTSQATVALRNASLYREVPFIDLLKPVLDRKRKFLALEKRRRALLVAGAAAALLFLLIFPLPLRVVGDASVSPTQSVLIQPEVEGVVQTRQRSRGRCGDRGNRPGHSFGLAVPGATGRCPGQV